MMTAEEHIAKIYRNSGRKPGSRILNPVRVVYRKMKQNGSISMEYRQFSDLISAIATGIWKKVYAGNTVAVPYLFNMEIIPNRHKWVRTINWKRTHKLWLEDQEAFQERLLVRHEPSRFLLKVRHSTITRHPKRWYYPLLFEIRPSSCRTKDIETKYELQ